MFKKFNIFLLTATLVLVTNTLYAGQYLNYVWGTSKEKTAEQVIENGYEIYAQGNLIEDGKEYIIYFDEFNGHKIRVALFFTLQSKNLSNIVIKSDNSSVGIDFKTVLTEKYGKPVIRNIDRDEYKWLYNRKRVSIILRHNNDTEIMYYGTNFDTYIKEYKELAEKANKQ